MSGMRKAPPISTSSPRDTMTSFLGASEFSTRYTAAALLFTTTAASALVVEHRAQGFDYERTAVPVDESDDRVELEQAVDRRQRATRGSGGIQHDRGDERRVAANGGRRVNMGGTGAHGAGLRQGQGT